MKENFLTDFLLPIIKAVLLAVIVTLAGVLIFAFLLKFLSLTHISVKIVNQFIKVASIFIGGLIFLKEGKGIVKGILLGVLYAIIVQAVFSLISGTALKFEWLDLGFCILIGGISGIIAVNLKSKEY